MISGKNILVFIKNSDGDLLPVSCDKSCTLNMKQNFIRATNPNDSDWIYSIATERSWNITGNGMTDFSKKMGIHVMQQYIIDRYIFVVKFQAVKGSDAIVYVGQGQIESTSINGAIGQLSSFDYMIRGIGKLEIQNTIPENGGGGGGQTMETVERLQFIATLNQSSYQNVELIGAKLLWFSVASQDLYRGTKNYQMSGLDPVTGTIAWNYPTANGNECIILYKK